MTDKAIYTKEGWVFVFSPEDYGSFFNMHSSYVNPFLEFLLFHYPDVDLDFRTAYSVYINKQTREKLEEISMGFLTLQGLLP